MAKGKRALRYASEADMPASMRRLLPKGASAVVLGVDPGRDEEHVEALGLLSSDKGFAIASVAVTKKNKYGNYVTRVDGIRFDSKKEAAYYEQLKLRQLAGEVLYWLRQVPVHLPGGTRYVVDFLVFFVDQGRAPEYVDVKGRETPMFRVKRREVEHHYPIRITLA